MSVTPEQIAAERADWLLDAIAGATQDRQFLRGDAECNPVVCEAVLLNGAKAILIALARAHVQRVSMLESALEQIAACHIEYSESHAACYGPPILSAEQMAATAFATLALHRAALKATP